MNEDTRLTLLRKITMCDTTGDLLDTSVIDQLLSLFTSRKRYIFSTLCPLRGKMNPFYRNYVSQHRYDEDMEMVVLPLCDNAHFFGYIVDIQNRRIIAVDSINQPKFGKRSIGAALKEKYFEQADDVLHLSYYPKRVQTDASSCGAWLIAGVVGYLLGVEKHTNVLDRDKVFDIVTMLTEDLEFSTKCDRAVYLLGSKCSSTKEIPTTVKSKKCTFDGSDDSIRIPLSVKSQKCTFDGSDDSIPIPLSVKRRKYTFDDSNDSIPISFSSTECSTPQKYEGISSHVDKSLDLSISSASSGQDTENYIEEQQCDDIADDADSSMRRIPAVSEKTSYPINTLLAADEIIHLLLNIEGKCTVNSIPDGVKEDLYFILSEDSNIARSNAGKNKMYPDDCGVWDSSKGKTAKTHFIHDDHGNLKFVEIRGGRYCTLRRQSKTKVYDEVVPQPLKENVITLSRYYTTLKRDNNFKRRISRLELPSNSRLSYCLGYAIVEYRGKYPTEMAPHGNSRRQNEMFTRTKPELLEKISSMSDGRTGREVYKEMVLDDSINCPRNLQQLRNIKYQKTKNQRGVNNGNRNNLADEVLDCLSLVDTHGFVRHYSKSEGRMPNLVCYTEDQRKDLLFFLSQKSNYAIGIDRTFNLGKFFVTAMVYKNLRVVRGDNSKEHPIFVGPVFLHRDADYEAYNYFLSTVKASLCSEDTVNSFELLLGKDIHIGSDEERALTKAIDCNFPASTRFLCTKHLKDGTRAYLQTQVGVPQKERNDICKTIFGEDGLVNADDSFDFDDLSTKILVQSSKYPKFSKYFTKKLKPCIEAYVNRPNRETAVSKWTNNNAESLNHIMKLDADWKVKTTPQLIEMLHQMTLVQFKDFKRALYGEGNYRLHHNFKKNLFPPASWKSFDKAKQRQIFNSFLSSRRKSVPEGKTVKSSYCNFTVPSLNTAKKPGQRTRIRSSKTKKGTRGSKDFSRK